MITEEDLLKIINELKGIGKIYPLPESEMEITAFKMWLVYSSNAENLNNDNVYDLWCEYKEYIERLLKPQLMPIPVDLDEHKCAKGFNMRRHWCLGCEFEKECEFDD
jgi:hypothetical protein